MTFIEKNVTENVFEGKKDDESKDDVERKKAPPIKTIFAKYGISTSLSVEANEYLKEIRAILEDSTNLVKIKTKKLMRPSGAVLFSSERYGVILLFGNTYTNDIYQILRNTLITTAIADAKEQHKNIKILNVVMVTEHDYGKYQAMADYINSLLMIYEDNEQEIIDITSFTNSNTFVIETDTDIVRERFFSRYPHGVMPRSDIGFTCYVSNKENVYRNQRSEFIDKDELFSVVGYTEIVSNVAGQYADPKMIKFTPVIHLTGISCAVWSTRILPLVIGMSAEIFGAYELWKSPYRALKKNNINIGNIMIDPKTNKPRDFKSEGDLEMFLNTSFTPPVIVIDVVEGKARIPGLSLFVDRRQHKVLASEILSFFRSNAENSINVVGNDRVIQECVGHAQLKGIFGQDAQIIDSRYVDYLNMVKLLGYDENVAKLFFKYSLDPIKKAEVVRNIVPDVKFTHLCLSVVLNGKVLSNLVEVLSHYVNIINPLSGAINVSVDVKGLLNNAYSYGPTIGQQRSPIPTPIWDNTYDIV